MPEKSDNDEQNKLNVTDELNTQNVSAEYAFDDALHIFSELDTRPALGQRRVLRLFIPQETDPLEFFSPERVVMGRGGKDIHLDLNLAEHYGWMLGVSRQHAEIIYDEAQYYIADLNSTNGTWLNSTKLNPNERYPLDSHDQIRMGHFLMLVSLSS